MVFARGKVFTVSRYLAIFALAPLVFGAGICQQGSTFRADVPSPCLASPQQIPVVS